MHTQRHGRIVHQQPAGALEQHVGDLVGGVAAVLRDPAEGDELGPLGGAPPGGHIRPVEVHEILIHPAEREAVQVAVQRHGDLVHVHRLHGFQEGAGRVLRHPLESTGHLQQLGPARSVGTDGSLPAALRPVTPGEGHGGVGRGDDRPVELLFEGVLAVKPPLDGGDLLQSLPLYGGKAHAD